MSSLRLAVMQQSAAEKDRARTVCKKRDVSELEPQVSGSQAKKPRLVFTDLQRRTLQAIFKETKRPSKEMQVTIARQLGLDPSTVSNFFMNARRRSVDKWKDDKAEAALQEFSEDEDYIEDQNHEEMDNSPPSHHLALHHSSSSTRYTTEAA